MTKQWFNICLFLIPIMLFSCTQEGITQEGDSGEPSTEKAIEQDKEEYHIIRVLTYNILHGKAADGTIDMDLYGDIINEHNPDLVALQEVDKNTRRTGNLDVTAELSRRTGLKGFFGKYRNYGGGEYGDAILSKFPVLDFKVVPAYFTPEGKKRTYSFAKVKIADNATIFFNTSHLTPYVQEDRRLQAQELVDYYKDTLEEAPLLICGDLNTEPGSEGMNILFEAFAEADTTMAKTFSARSTPRKKIDYILHPKNDNWKVFDVKTICRGDASDHCAVFAVLGYKKSAF